MNNRCGYYKQYQQNIKHIVIAHYGGRCEQCGETEIVFLAIDHIAGNGRKHRRIIGGSNTNYRWIINNDFPKMFRVLCHNCNSKIELQRRRNNYIYSYINDAQRKHNRKLKMLVVNHYGNKCACCNETDIDLLTIDHIDGGGNKHRKLAGNGAHLYNWLIKHNFPKGYQILCWNCNLGKSINGGICPHKL